MDIPSFSLPFASQDPFFCGIKIKLMRNLEGHLFPSKMDEEKKKKAHIALSASLKQIFPNALSFEPPYELELKETYSEAGGQGTSLWLNPKENCVVSIMDQDHITLSVHTKKRDLKSLLELIQNLERALKNHFSFALSPSVGYLTAMPEFSGHGVQLEAFLFCPFLQAFPPCPSKLVIEEIWLGSGFIRIQTTSSVNEELTGYIQGLLQTLDLLQQEEIQAKEKALKEKKDSVFDSVAKSLALLKGAYQLTFAEAREHLLHLKKGFSLQMLEGLDQDRFLEWIQHAQKGHLSRLLNKQETTDDWLHERAAWMQKELSSVTLKTL